MIRKAYQVGLKQYMIFAANIKISLLTNNVIIMITQLFNLTKKISRLNLHKLIKNKKGKYMPSISYIIPRDRNGFFMARHQLNGIVMPGNPVEGKPVISAQQSLFEQTGLRVDNIHMIHYKKGIQNQFVETPDVIIYTGRISSISNTIMDKNFRSPVYFLVDGNPDEISSYSCRGLESFSWLLKTMQDEKNILRHIIPKIMEKC